MANISCVVSGKQNTKTKLSFCKLCRSLLCVSNGRYKCIQCNETERINPMDRIIVIKNIYNPSSLKITKNQISKYSINTDVNFSILHI